MACLLAVAATARSVPSGRLLVAVPLALGHLVVAPALGRFRALYPAVDLEMRLSDRFVDPVQDGVDVALRIGELADTRLVSRRLAPHRVVVLAAPSYLARRGRPDRPEDLFAHDCIDFRFTTSGRLFRWPFIVDGKRVEIAPPGVMVADDGEALAALAEAGIGVAMIATYIAAPLVQAGRLVPLLTTFVAEQAPISVLYPESRRTSPAVRAFVAFISELIPPRPVWDDILLGHGSHEVEAASPAPDVEGNV